MGGVDRHGTGPTWRVCVTGWWLQRNWSDRGEGRRDSELGAVARAPRCAPVRRAPNVQQGHDHHVASSCTVPGCWCRTPVDRVADDAVLLSSATGVSSGVASLRHGCLRCLSAVAVYVACPYESQCDGRCRPDCACTFPSSGPRTELGDRGGPASPGGHTSRHAP